MHLQLPDEALTGLLKQDDHLALETLFNRHYKPLCQFCTVYTGNMEVAEEIVADLFIKLWDSRRSLAILNVKSYLFISAKNMALNHKQKKKAPVDLMEDLNIVHDTVKDTNTPLRILTARESYSSIISTIDTLPAGQRQVLLMSRVDNMDKKDISRILGISVRTVETTLYQAVKRVRHLLKDSLNYTAGS